MVGRFITYSSVAVHLVALPNCLVEHPLEMSCLAVVKQGRMTRTAAQPSR